MRERDRERERESEWSGILINLGASLFLAVTVISCPIAI